MHFSVQPQLIRRDSTVPLRMMFVGWIMGVVATMVVGPVENTALAVMGFTLLAGGLIAATLNSTRMWRMLIGAAGGGVAAWLGWRFAIEDRLLPAVRDDPFELFDREHIGALGVGLGTLAIGVGGVLEAMRAQNEPGRSPLVVRLLLIAIGMIISASICVQAGVGVPMTIVVAVVIGLAMAAMAWLRTERPLADFQPAP